jgi:hypothetical protein
MLASRRSRLPDARPASGPGGHGASSSFSRLRCCRFELRRNDLLSSLRNLVKSSIDGSDVPFQYWFQTATKKLSTIERHRLALGASMRVRWSTAQVHGKCD